MTDKQKVQVELLNEWISMDRDTIKGNDDSIDFFEGLKNRHYTDRTLAKQIVEIIKQEENQKQLMKEQIAKHKKEIRNICDTSGSTQVTQEQ